MNKDFEHVALDCWGKICNKSKFFIVFEINRHLLTIFIQLGLVLDLELEELVISRTRSETRELTLHLAPH